MSDTAMIVLLLLGCVGVVALSQEGWGLWQLGRRRQGGLRSRRAEVAPETAEDSPWAGAELVYPEQRPACPAVRKLSGKRLLLSELPDLPLPDCSCQGCGCEYRYFDDRRTVARETEAEPGVIARITHWLPVEGMRSAAKQRADLRSRQSVSERERARAQWRAKKAAHVQRREQNQPTGAKPRQAKVSLYQR